MRSQKLGTGLSALALFAGCCVISPALAQSASSTSTSPWPLKTFLSEPLLHPLTVNTSVTGKPSKGLLFLATDGPVAAANGGPLIVDENGDEVYVARGHAFNFGPQTYKGAPVITWWNGTVFPEPIGRGYGNILIADTSYQIIANVSLSGNFQTQNASQKYDSYVDLHEIFITDRNSVIVTANNVTTANLKSIGGSENAYVVDSQVYEIDIESNEVLFSWKSLDHLDQLPFSDSVYPLGSEGFTGQNQSTSWAYFHINSATVFEDGYLISSRYFCSIMAIDKTGHVKWRVQGRSGGDFHLASDAHFCFQHDARPISIQGSEIVFSVHDNENSPLTEPDPTTPSSGLVLKLDLEARTAVAVDRYKNPKKPVYSSAQGSYQGLSDGNVVVGHGFVPVIEEYSHDGQIVATTQFGNIVDGQSVPVGGVLSYRAFKAEWTGCPSTPPAIATSPDSDGLTVAMSWNGATEFTGWEILAGESPQKLKVVKSVAKKGFETIASIPKAPYVQAKATGGSACGPKAPRLSKVIKTGSSSCRKV